MSKQRYIIVVADDDPGINELYSQMLADEGYQVYCCFSGDEAARVIQRIQPDLAVVDMQMETRDAGLRLLQSLRQNPQTMRLSVIICSADAGYLDSTKQHFSELGALVITKPFDIDHFLQNVEKLLMLAQS